MRTQNSNVPVGSTWVVVGALALALGAAIPSAAAAGSKVTCRGPNSLDGFFRLQNHRQVTGKRVGCAAARKVAKVFSRRCFDAYAAQGRCNVRASGSWRCRSRIVGSLVAGAPSRESCRRRRARIAFEIAYFPPTEPIGADVEPIAAGASARASEEPYDAGRECIDTSQVGTVLSPPLAPEDSWEIHLLGDVSRETGEGLQQALVTHRVGQRLFLGLLADPPHWPSRVPIFLTAGTFVGAHYRGVNAPMCANRARDAIVVATGASSFEGAAAHELFHSYSHGLVRGRPWWEEASATWAESKLGFPEFEGLDHNLQFPNYPLDALTLCSYPLNTLQPCGYWYAMSRFVQFLDLKALIDGSFGGWPLQHDVISGYPDASGALDAELAKSSTSLGEQLAAFWGDRLRETPVVAPSKRLIPSPPYNATRVVVTPGREEEQIDAKPPHTVLTDFWLANQVTRVEFEFHPPPDGYFWGATDLNESRRFFNGDSVAFCVGGAHGDALEWPGHFPVTFTNGALDGGAATGAITIYAQTDPDQCQDPNQNRACRALSKANVAGVLGVPLYPGQSGLGGSMGVEDGLPYVGCVYTGRQGLSVLKIVRWKSPRDLRRNVRESCKALQRCEPLKLGDVAVVKDLDLHAGVGVALGHDGIALEVTRQSGARAGAIELARGVVKALG